MSLLKFLSPTVKVYRSSDRSFIYGAVSKSFSVDKARVHRNKNKFLQFGSKLKARNTKFGCHVEGI